MTLPKYAMNQSNFAEMYEGRLVGSLFRPFAEVIVERLKIAPGERVLDLACGTGIVARLAKQRLGDTGRVVGVDLSAQMLEVGRSIAPGIEWREGNAAALPFAAGEQFDAVLCHQGLQFFPDQAAALREMRRVLAPGGRLAVATWCALEDTPFFLALHRVAERHLGAMPDPRYGFGDAAALQKLLAAAGLQNVNVETVSRTVRFADGMVYVQMNAMALVGMSKQFATTTPEQRARLIADIVQDSAEVLLPYADGAGIAFALGTNLATARG